MFDNPYAGLAAACYGVIAVLLFYSAMLNNPHFWRPDHRIQLVCLIFFSAIWPITMPVAIFFYSRSPEGKLMKMKRRRSSGQHPGLRPDEVAVRLPEPPVSGRQFAPQTRRNRPMTNTPTPRQRQLVAHVIDMAVSITQIAAEDTTDLTGSTRFAEKFDLDSLDAVEFIITAEDRWPGLEILEDDKVEKIIYEGTIRDVAVWLEGLLVAQFGGDWQPSPRLEVYPD